MTQVHIDRQTLTIQMRGFDKLWTFKSQLRFPLSHVSAATPAEGEARRWWHGIRAPGTHLPGVITAGTFYTRQGRVFWNVRNPECAIAIALQDDGYAKLVIEVQHPAAEIARIKTALTERQSG